MGESVHGPGDAGGLVLVLNSGSSSVKFAVLAPASGERVLAGMAGQVGTPEAELQVRRYPGRVVTEQLPEGSYEAVISRILGHLPEAGLNAAGRRHWMPVRTDVMRCVLKPSQCIRPI